MQEKFIKLIAGILTIILLCSQSGLTVSWAVNELLTDEELESQDTTSDRNVDFDVYYEDGKHTKKISINGDAENNATINAKISLKNIGYIEDGVIDFSNSNFKVSDENNQEIIKKINDNKVILNRLTGGEEIIVSLNITPNAENKVTSDFFNKDNNITFTGTFTNANEKNFNINLNVVIHTEYIVENVETFINQSITKYVPFNLGNQAGILLQTTLNTGVINNKVPVRTSQIEIQVPKLGYELPEKVDLVAVSTNLEGVDLNKEDWSYEEKTGIVTINLVNSEDEEGKISWMKNASDTFNLVCIYSKNVLEKVYESGVNVNLKSKVGYSFYGTDKKDSKIDENTYYVKDQVGSLIDITTKITTQRINKGYMYTNKSASEENKNETVYNKEYSINISDTNLVDEIILSEENDIFISEIGIYDKGNLKNKSIKIDKKELKNIFGENGNLELNIGEKTIYINKDSDEDNDGNIIINLEEYTGNIKLSVTKPVEPGTLTIKLTKAIAKDQNYSIEEIKTFKSLQTNTSLIAKCNGGEIPVNKQETKVELEEPTSKITANINKENLSTVVTNDNVEIKAILETDSIDDVLYKNPKILIAFPSYVTGIDITNLKSLYSDEIEISSVEMKESEGKKVVIVNFEGTQTLYNDETTKGINVILNATVDVDRLAPSTNEKIQIIYTNENDEYQRSIEIPIKFVAPVGLVTVNELEGYEDEKSNLVVVNQNDIQNEEKAIISTYSKAKTAIAKGTVINNYNNSLSNMVILGRIPNSDTNGNTFNTELQNEINVNINNAKVYYSASANPTVDLQNSENGWVEGKVNYRNVKSFLIVIDDTIEKGSKIEFEYPINIPEKLSFNNSAELTYEVKYNNNDVSGVKNESRNSSNIIITTGEGPNLEVKVHTDEAINGELKQGQYVRFTATIKNIGTDATGVKVAIDETYGKVKKYNDAFEFEDEENVKEIGDLKAGEITKINYILQVNENAELLDDAEFRVGAVADKINSVITGSQNIKITEGKLLLNNIIIASKSGTNSAQLVKGENGSCGLYIKNISGKILENVTVRYKVGNEINIKEAGEVSTFYSPLTNSDAAIISTDKHTVTYIIDKIDADETKMIRLNYEVAEVGTDVAFKAGITLQAGDTSWNMNANTQTVNIKEYKAEIRSLQIDSKNQERKPGEEVTYAYAVKNTGDLIISIGKVECVIPDGVTFKNAKIASRINGEDIYSETIEAIESNTFEYEKTFLEVGEELVINVIAVVDELSGANEKELNMKAKFTAMGIEKESDPEIYYAVYDEEEKNTYKITGKVWRDENKNSKKDDEEIGLEGVTVALFDKATMKVVTSAETSKDGNYEFTGLTNGKYLVAYLYNNEDYELSEYQKDDILDSQNSDATTSKAKYNGEDKAIALTDVIEINNASKRNIDLGLIEKDKFDLGLVKEISKITINENGNIKETNYEKASSLAQVKINNSENAATMIAEYKVTITNNGNVPGYANKVVSYLSDDMKFSSELNPDWYLGEDGNVYSTALANYELQVGETRELKLILTKNISTSEETELKDIINNKSKISEEYNEKGIESTKEFNAKEKTATASIEVVRGNNNLVIIIVLLLIAIVVTSGSFIYIRKENIRSKIYDNKAYIKIKRKCKKIYTQVKEKIKRIV